MFSPALPKRRRVGPNPFSDAASLAARRYTAPQGERLVHPFDLEREPDHFAHAVHHAFRQWVLDPAYPCLGARAALRQATYRFGTYPEMGSAVSTAGLAHDLFCFAAEQARANQDYATFWASFAQPEAVDEREFEAQLWGQLQSLHDLDAPHHEWDRTVSADPENPHFQWSFAGCAFFVVGLHPRSSRLARSFPWPTLVFNTHLQFERLRAWDQYDRFRDTIRARDAALQGKVNPVLTDFGDRSAARQYSGRHVEPEWKCPFHAHFADRAESDPAGEPEVHGQG